MATTDARPGFKLPWSADRSESDSQDAAPAAADGARQEAEVPAEPTAAELEAPPVAVDTASEPLDQPPVPAGEAASNAGAEPPAEPVEAVAPPASYDPWRLDSTPVGPVVARRKPNKLMADLTRAMQTAAEAARDETMARLQTDAKAFVESIHVASGTEAEELRRTADTDVAGIREWSKTEIARIREETDERIAHRKATLEREIEAHAARIEGRIERVQAHVAWFETEMAGFFERLLAEDDPTHLAAMAENLPEPPSFEDDLVDRPDIEPALTAGPVLEAVAEPVADEPEVVAEAPVEAPEVVTGTDASGEAATDPEASFAAIQAAAEAAEAEQREPEQAEPFDAPPTVMGNEPTDAVPADDDPRLAVLGLSPEAAAEAEAEAEAEVPSPDAADESAMLSDDALAARLAGLLPGADGVPHVELHSTRVVVTGLISVASIAGFKRQLGRLAGVSSVGVSSGPDGEFVFAVMHAPEADLRGTIPTLPGFEARVTNSTDDTVSVAARDPETES